MPVNALAERTAPWKAMLVHAFEIIILAVTSGGSLLVRRSGPDAGQACVPYVAVTVAIVAALNSFLEIARLAKQIEPYKEAAPFDKEAAPFDKEDEDDEDDDEDVEEFRDLCSMLIKWDGMTRTERRTRETVCKVVSAVEVAMEEMNSAAHPREHDCAGGHVRMVADAFAYLALGLLLCAVLCAQL